MIDGIQIIDSHMHYMGRFKKRDMSLVDYLDTYNIDKAVITSLNKSTSLNKIKKAMGTNLNVGKDSGDFLKHFDLTSQLDHTPVKNIIEKHPDRFIGFYWFNPKNPTEEDWAQLERYIEDFRFKGVKVHPAVNMLRVPKDLYELAEFCIDHDIPMYYHSGPGFFFQRAFRAKHLFKLVRKFPELKLIIGHAAYTMEYVLNLLTYFSNNADNVYFETSVSIPYGIYTLVKALGSDKVIFGTDSPPASNPAVEIEKIKILDLERETLEKIFHQNLEDLLKI